MYARTVNGETTVSFPPSLYHDGNRWWDLRNATAEQLAQHGWHRVVEVDRPDDDTQAYDMSIELVNGQPVQTWTARPWTTAEKNERIESNARLDDLTARIERIEAKLWPASPDAASWEDLDGVWPMETLLSDGGKVWRNISGVPLTTPPSQFPTGNWSHLFVEEGSTVEEGPGASEWTTGRAYAVGDLVIFASKTYTCRQAHTSQAGWSPDVVAALWALVP